MGLRKELYGLLPISYWLSNQSILKQRLSVWPKRIYSILYVYGSIVLLQKPHKSNILGTPDGMIRKNMGKISAKNCKQ